MHKVFLQRLGGDYKNSLSFTANPDYSGNQKNFFFRNFFIVAESGTDLNR